MHNLAAIIESVPIAIVLVDGEGIIHLVNRQAEQLFICDRENLLGSCVERLLPEESRGVHPKLREEFFEHPEARPMGAGRDLFALRRDGSEFPVEIGLNPIELHGERYVLATIVDITERMRRAEELKRAMDALEQSNLELKEFAYIASHDLQAPLRSISGFVQLLEHRYADALDDDAREWIGYAVEGAKQMGVLINDLLSYSRIDSAGRSFAPVDLEAILEEVVSTLGDEIEATGAEVTHRDLPTVFGDRVQLVQLFQNLIENALKYRSESPPRVRISGMEADDGWIVSIEDNGIGIAPEHEERIFEIFRRLHSDDAYPGTGIGLAVCRRVVHRHGGRIWVESEPGKGSTFRISFPAPSGERQHEER